MATTTITYPVALGSLPDAAVTWKDSDKTVIDFSTGWTFTAKVGKAGRAATINKTTGFTGAATAPNLTIAWAADELAELSAGEWVVQIEATRTSDSKKRYATIPLSIEAKAVT